MAPPLQAITIILAAACLLVVIVSSSEELAGLPSPTITTAAAASAPLHASGLLYTMLYRIGDTAVSGIADTGSDLIWTNNSQLFDSSVSCPFEAGEEMKVTCCHDDLATFEREYGGAVKVRGVMGEAKLTFEAGQSSYTTPALNIGSAVMFGCHLPVRADPKQDCRAYRRGGIVGLARGKMSLVSQLGLHSFSYCLPHHSSASQATGQIKFNDTAAVSLEGTKTTTKLEKIEGLKYPASSRYYVGLKEIEMASTTNGEQWLASLPNGCFQKDRSGNGGMVIDSGSSFTSLPEDVMKLLEKQVEDLMERETRKKLDKVDKDGFSCYKGTYPKDLGNIVLRFCDAAVMEIPAKNYFYQDTEDSFCLAFKKQQAGDSDQMSLLGAYQQQDIHMLFNIKENTLSFRKQSACGQS